MASDKKRPEWAPAEGGEGFNCEVVPGGERAENLAAVPKRRKLGKDDYIRGIRKGDRTTLARAITLVESNAAQHEEMAQAILKELLPSTGNSIRIGITGIPGVGKSTFIEALGEYLCAEGHRVAVLAVDPSSSLTRGSVLGDKTRMEQLARNPRAFIRPSATGGNLGGVARKTRETLMLCEAFGFDIILLETVGVGQSEVTVRSMVDCFLLLQIAGAGDELQGIKKGVVELADIIVVNKADGDNLQRANLAKAEFNRVLHYLQPITAGWKPKAVTVSSMTGAGIQELWYLLQSFVEATREHQVFDQRRQQQNADWFESLLDEAIRRRYYEQAGIRDQLSNLRRKVAAGELPAAMAVERMMNRQPQ
ncbi:MAG: methylmalonyl Co-A mutase-associated GTPase MeaB [Opitutales bacterium]|nr:methylmalonyl Co-A mutase-associated GTPase MeaB [Opitutales bacterium]